MPPHRDWTRRGVGRALLWWPLTAFLLVAAFPAVAVPAMVGSGVLLVLVGLVGGVLGRRWRAHRLRRAGRTIGTAPRDGADVSTAPASGAADEKESPTSTDSPGDDGPDVRAA